VTIRGVERFAFVALLSSLVLITADRVLHPRGFFFLLPSPRHFGGLWRPIWIVFRARPALTAGVTLLLLGLCAALIAACADVGRVLTRGQTSSNAE
jgi:hypothetical protein